MFINASALCAVLLNEPDAPAMVKAMEEAHGKLMISPVIRVETTLAIVRRLKDAEGATILRKPISHDDTEQMNPGLEAWACGERPGEWIKENRVVRLVRPWAAPLARTGLTAGHDERAQRPKAARLTA